MADQDYKPGIEWEMPSLAMPATTFDYGWDAGDGDAFPFPVADPGLAAERGSLFQGQY